jgi:hypothetical protein
VALARLLREPRAPPVGFWDAELLSSRLLEYEIWNRIYAYRLLESRGDEARNLLAGLELAEMSASVLARALEPFPAPVRTLDALHLATVDFLRGQGEPVELASYDNRLLAAARALEIPIAVL